MTNRIRGTHAVAFAVLAVAAPTAAAEPVSVNLRVEGQSTTIFDGPVTTDGHAVTTQSSGTHPCDGTNGGSSPTPVPTATAALDESIEYARDRKQFDKPIADFQAIQWMIADSKTELDASRLLCLRAASMKARMRAGSLRPGADSTPEETSTPRAPVVFSARRTLPASSPPERR